MKAIKNIKNIVFLLFVFMSPSIFAQIHEHKNIPFVGVWEYIHENKIFRLILWEEHQPDPDDKSYYLDGHYEMVEIDGATEVVLFTSDPGSMLNGKGYPVAFRGNVDNKVCKGEFKEADYKRSGFIGDFTIELLAPCDDCLPRINWKVFNLSRMEFATSKIVPVSDLVMPNNVNLIKVN